MNIKKINECFDIPTFADNSALFQVANLYDIQYEDISEEKRIKIELDYPNVYRNKEIHLTKDVMLFKEMGKKQWENEKKTLKSYNKGGYISISAKDFDEKVDKIATVAHYIRSVCHKLSSYAKKPVVLVLNARSATPYGYIYKDEIDVIPYNSNKGVISDINEIVEEINRNRIQSAIVVMSDFKISSREYVQTELEAKMLSGINPEINKLRKTYLWDRCYVNENIPQAFLDYVKMGYPVVFVDVPTWGKYYASSTGLIRKNKDILKRKQGIFTPYKMKTYMEYAGYQIAALSLHKIYAKDTEDIIEIPEENLGRIDSTRAFCLMLNPEKSNDIWWDNCPQITGARGKKYSDTDLEENGFDDNIILTTNKGEMSIFEYVKLRVGGATIDYI